MPDLAGIFTGGRGERMGGLAKGLLQSPSGETLVARWQRLFVELGRTPVLVGFHEAYADLDIECIADDPPHIGPLGGLVALLARAGEGTVIAVACDMPFVSAALLAKLASFVSQAPAIAPRHHDVWEPLFARYHAPRARALARKHALAGEKSLQRLLDALGAEPLPLGPHELDELRDWDRPEDR